jgi:hypothetical protein
MTREQIATALEAAAYFYRAGRAEAGLLDALYAIASGSPTMTQNNAVTILLEDWAEVQAGTLS